MRIQAGFAMCGSFCTFQRVLQVMQAVRDTGADVIPIMSPAAYETDTRFGTAASFREQILDICGNKIIHTIPQAEPIGPKQQLDILIIAPCTGNTLGKLASGIADTSVTLAAKAHLRNERPLLIAVSSNDALAANAANIGVLLNRKHVYFVPMSQDDPLRKPRSIVAEMEQIPAAMEAALQGDQLQPILYRT